MSKKNIIERDRQYRVYRCDNHGRCWSNLKKTADFKGIRQFPDVAIISVFEMNRLNKRNIFLTHLLYFFCINIILINRILDATEELFRWFKTSPNSSISLTISDDTINLLTNMITVNVSNVYTSNNATRSMAACTRTINMKLLNVSAFMRGK